MNIISILKNNNFIPCLSNFANEIYHEYKKILISKELQEKIWYKLFGKCTTHFNDNILQIKRQPMIKHSYKTINKQQKILYKQINKNKYNKLIYCYIKN
jgi:hypothetical protein